MSSSFEPKFRTAYRNWKTHDLTFREGRIRPWFYKGLREQDELLVWQFIEENYLSCYKDFVGVRFEYASDGLWRIPFPGSVAYGNYIDARDLNLPTGVVEKLRAWHDELDIYEPRIEGVEDGFDYEASDEKGLLAAKEVKLFLGEECYVEFRPFHEIALVDGVPLEIGVPEFILSLNNDNDAEKG